jgi:hypothetical protein
MRSNQIKLLIFFGLMISNLVIADDCKDKDKNCPVPKKVVCFNILCNYQKRHDEKGKYESCRSAAKFQKWVAEDGREVRDNSARPYNPRFEVECDYMTIFNNSANRYTDRLGTRIQAKKGPYPATLLPRGALHEGHGYSLSALEVEGQILRGHCYIYTGEALL